MRTHIFPCERIMSVVFPWISSPHGSLGLAHHRHAYCLWELSDANTQTLSGPLTLIRSLWYLEGQMVVVGIRAPGLTPLSIAGWLALGYEALGSQSGVVVFSKIVTMAHPWGLDMDAFVSSKNGLGPSLVITGLYAIFHCIWSGKLSSVFYHTIDVFIKVL